MGLLKANIVTSYYNQEMLTSLWYETIPANPVGIDYLAAAQGLGEWVRDNVCASAVGQSRLQDFLPANGAIKRVEVQAYSPPSIGSINPVELLTAPQVVSANFLPVIGAGQAFAPAACARVKLNCAAVTLNPLDYTPAGGYILTPPVPEGNVFDTGEIQGSYLTALNNFGAALLAIADIGGGFTARPVRVGVAKVGRIPPGVFGWSPITSAAGANQVTWRKSRIPR